MRVAFMFVLLLLSACQQAVMPDHLGCPEQEHAEGCVLAEDGETNKDLFTTINPGLVQTETVAYAKDTNGFLAQPKEPGTYPGIMMIHEWWGLNDNIRDMAVLLAQEGYVVLAVDLYGEVAETQEKARALSSAARANPEITVENMRAAVKYLRSRENVNAERIASMGWCFGGGQSLQLALSGEQLAATVIYYGNLVTEKEQLSAIQWPVLGIFGEEDTGIPVAQVREFEQALTELNIPNEIRAYTGVGHAFANPSGARYAPDETLDAWEKTVKFLDQHLKS